MVVRTTSSNLKIKTIDLFTDADELDVTPPKETSFPNESISKSYYANSLPLPLFKTPAALLAINCKSISVPTSLRGVAIRLTEETFKFLRVASGTIQRDIENIHEASLQISRRYNHKNMNSISDLSRTDLQMKERDRQLTEVKSLDQRKKGLERALEGLRLRYEKAPKRNEQLRTRVESLLRTVLTQIPSRPSSEEVKWEGEIARMRRKFNDYQKTLTAVSGSQIEF